MEYDKLKDKFFLGTSTREEEDELRRYLEGYSALDRQLIYLRFYEGNTYREIAQKLQMKKSNVHRRITKILKEILKK